MLKSSIVRQKKEKERILAVELFGLVPRSVEKEAEYYLASDLIKVVLGPRRAGKSMFLFRILKDLEFAYFNFDDISFSNEKFDSNIFIEELKEIYGDFKYVYFDEVQNLDRWELFVNQLKREGCNIFVTGSNANLLSQELATVLTGRHISIEVFPFSFSELLRINNNSNTEQVFENYLSSGGFPEVVMNSFQDKGYLYSLYGSLLFKDVVKRHKIRKGQQVENLGNYFLSNIATLYNAKKLYQNIGFNSDKTLDKFFSYLNETYLLYSLQKYDFKAKVRINSGKKVYTVDNGFIKAVGVSHSEDKGKLFENLVFVELLKQGYSPNKNLFYFKTKNNREVDFVLKSKEELTLLQACYDMSSYETEAREVAALLDAAKELNVQDLTILTATEDKVILVGEIQIKVVSFSKYFR